jgi:predicted nucleic acid-binding protein
VRVVLDTNILISALIGCGTAPDRLYELWKSIEVAYRTIVRASTEIDFGAI